MAIIRSKIARQLLAEGGAPRKPFANCGFDYESDGGFYAVNFKKFITPRWLSGFELRPYDGILF